MDRRFRASKDVHALALHDLVRGLVSHGWPVVLTSLLQTQTARHIRTLDQEWMSACDRRDAGSIQRIFLPAARMTHGSGAVSETSNQITATERVASG
jgi:hypothetical protein